MGLMSEAYAELGRIEREKRVAEMRKRGVERTVTVRVVCEVFEGVRGESGTHREVTTIPVAEHTYTEFFEYDAPTPRPTQEDAYWQAASFFMPSAG